MRNAQEAGDVMSEVMNELRRLSKHSEHKTIQNQEQQLMKATTLLLKRDAEIAELKEIIEFYAGTNSGKEPSFWEGNRFIALDKFGAVCEEISGPKLARDLLKRLGDV